MNKTKIETNTCRGIIQLYGKKYKIIYWQCQYCGHYFTDKEIEFSKIDIMQECPICYNSYSLHPIFEEVNK